MSVCVVMYAVNIVTGGDSSQLYLPFFETSLTSPSGGTGTAGSAQGTCGFVIGYFVLLALLSAMLGFAVRTDIRGLMLPWMAMMWVVVFFSSGLWSLAGLR